ncbi:MAG TPA: hypothetical protein VL383_10170 [Gemmatimonadaceae bacterium]|jgi:hypothetical protein|nr:hypothetical protein [Gemmatimonadaceae bacterium]
MIDRASRSAARPERRMLWQSVWGLEYVPPRSARKLVSWLDRLFDLPHDDWLAIADAVRRDSSRLERVGAARQRLAAIVSEHRLELVAWFVRDLVDTAVHHALRRDSSRDRESRAAAGAARDAAYLAALAIAARNWLTDADYQELSAPFAIGVGM